MKGLDTNVLVAWILSNADAPKLPDKGPFRVSYVALAELIWVFDKVYRRSRSEIAALVAMLLKTEGVDFESAATVKAALDDFLEGPADFADYLLMREGEASGCETTLTYDRKAGRNGGFTLLKVGR